MLGTEDCAVQNYAEHEDFAPPFSCIYTEMFMKHITNSDQPLSTPPPFLQYPTQGIYYHYMRVQENKTVYPITSTPKQLCYEYCIGRATVY